jgi:hypothetical protein
MLGRFSGSFSSIPSTMSSNGGGTCGHSVRSGGTGELRCIATIAIALSDTKGGRPHTIS